MEPLALGFFVSVFAASIQFHDTGYHTSGLEQPYAYQHQPYLHQPYVGRSSEEDRHFSPRYQAGYPYRHQLHQTPYQNETCIPFLGLPTTNFKLANLDPNTLEPRKCITQGSLQSVASIDCDSSKILPASAKWGIIPRKSDDPKSSRFQVQNQQSGKCIRVPSKSTTSDGRHFPTLEPCDKTDDQQIFRAVRCAYSVGSDGKKQLAYWRLAVEKMIDGDQFCLVHNPTWAPNPHFFSCNSDTGNNQWFNLLY